MILATSMAAPWEAVADENHLWGTGAVIQEVVGPIGLIILVIALTMGVFTGLNGFIMAGSRLLFAMSRARILPKSFGKLHPKYKTPHVAIIFTIVISAKNTGENNILFFETSVDKTELELIKILVTQSDSAKS